MVMMRLLVILSLHLSLNQTNTTQGGQHCITTHICISHKRKKEKERKRPTQKQLHTSCHIWTTLFHLFSNYNIFLSSQQHPTFCTRHSASTRKELEIFLGVLQTERRRIWENTIDCNKFRVFRLQLTSTVHSREIDCSCREKLNESCSGRVWACVGGLEVFLSVCLSANTNTRPIYLQIHQQTGRLCQCFWPMLDLNTITRDITRITN